MTDYLIFGVAVVVLIGIVTLMVMLERARMKAIGLELEAIGITLNREAGKPEKESAWRATGSPWSKLRTGAAGVQWYAMGEVRGRPVTIIEHRYTTGSGKSRSTHYNTIAATPAPGTWPGVELSPANLFHRIGELLGAKDFKVEDEEFNRRWRVKVDNEDFALLVLTPEVQAWAMRLPKGTMVRVGTGVITVSRAKTLKGTQCATLAKACVQLAELLPPELDAWEPLA